MLTVVSWAVGAALVCFSVRRLVLVGAALLPRRRPAGGQATPLTVTLVTAARNEGAHVERLLASLDELEYPHGSLFIMLVDDASEDDTGDRLATWSGGRERVRCVASPSRAGKSAALNQGIAAAPPSDLVAICDADLRPRADWLSRLAAEFADEEVGMASGALRPRNADASIVARYAAMESWVHQLVTSAGKDRLDLNPPAHGASLYRRSALGEIGGFPGGGQPGEDVQATAALTRAGWRTRFIPDAVTENTVTEGWRDYWQQHVRWARNVWASGAGARVSAGRRPLRRRVDMALSSLGYADRLVFVAAVALAAAGVLTPWLPVAYVCVTAAEVVVAVARAGALRLLPRLLASTAILFPVDVLASAAAGAAHLARRPRAWRTGSRGGRALPERLGPVEQGLAGQAGGVSSGDGAGRGGDVGDPR